MIKYNQLLKIASGAGLPVETIEKDYFIELFLLYFGKNKINDSLIFRGGTAIKKVYFPDYRFSEDLDFLASNDFKNPIDGLKNIIEQINHDFPAEIAMGKYTFKEGRTQIFVKYNIVSEIIAQKELKIDILQNHYLPPSHQRKIIFTYDEFKKSEAAILTYDLESVVVDKISRILDVVNEPRDIYDLWYLGKLNLDFEKIKKIFEEKNGFEIRGEQIIFEIKKEEYKTNWQIRLARQVPNLPVFDQVISELGEIISSKLS